MPSSVSASASGYRSPLSIFFVWHPLDKERVEPVFDECFKCLRRDVGRPFSRPVNVPVFLRTCAEGEVPGGITVTSKRAIIFAFIGTNCVSDDNWIPYLESLARTAGADMVPIALDTTAFNLSDELERLNGLRVFEYPEETFIEHTSIAIYHEIYRYGLNESRTELNRGKDSALKIFLSHAKDGAQGVAAAKALKKLIDDGPMREFFDATDIAAGYEFENEILAHIADSTLVAIHSDTYSSRYWCQREILAAKDNDRPILAVDLIGKFEDRRFPQAANLPGIRVPVEAKTVEEKTADGKVVKKTEYSLKDIDLLAILQATLLETIRFFYSWQILSEYSAVGWFSKDAHLSARPPEAYVLSRIAAEVAGQKDACLDFIYPDPPVYKEETAHFEQFGLKLGTPLTSMRLDLSAKKVGISISEPDDPDLLKIGQTKHHLQLLIQDVARYILGYRAELVYGGDLRPGGFTEFLFQEGHALQSRFKSLAIHLTNHIAWPIYLGDKPEMRDWKAKHRKVATMVSHDLPADVRDLVAAPTEFLPPSSPANSFVWSRSLTDMRRAMITSCDLRISAGGRLAGYKGWMPGVLEEIAIAVSMAKPVFLLGGFGGVTHSVCRLMTEKTLPADLTLGWQQRNTPGLKEMMAFAATRGVDYAQQYEAVLKLVMNADLRNGLTPEENARLFETPFVDEATHLMLKGISRLIPAP